MEQPPLGDIMRKCKHKMLWQKRLECPELLSTLALIVQGNNRDHLSCEVFQDAKSDFTSDHETVKQGEAIRVNLDPVRAAGTLSLYFVI